MNSKYFIVQHEFDNREREIELGINQQHSENILFLYHRWYKIESVCQEDHSRKIFIYLFHKYLLISKEY
jgi:hypothetical protein